MVTFQDTTDFYIQTPSAVTLGKFDGLHLGHQKLFKDILAQKKNALTSVVFMLNPHEEKLLLTEEEQKQILGKTGIDCLIRCPFVPEISGMSPEQFVSEVLVRRLHVKYIAVGTDFRFGYRRSGDAAFLKSFEDRYGFRVCIMEKEMYRGREISSTYVREALAGGNMELVRELTGRWFSVQGNVIRGKHLGSTMGMPTANLPAPAGKLLPPDGVYITKTALDSGDDDNAVMFRGITNIGFKPTVGQFDRGIETYLFSKEPELYGHTLKTQLLHYVRPEKKFENIDLLVRQIRNDIGLAMRWFGEQG